jgi:hypothetical protein
MLKMLLAGVAALFLATGAARADNEKWQSDFRHCAVTKQFTHDLKDEFRPGRSFGDADEVFVHENSTATITLDLENVLELQNISHCSKNVRRSGNALQIVSREK